MGKDSDVSVLNKVDQETFNTFMRGRGLGEYGTYLQDFWTDASNMVSGGVASTFGEAIYLKLDSETKDALVAYMS